MAYQIAFLESGSNATFGLHAYDFTSGSPASSAAQAHTGSRSVRLGNGDQIARLAVLADLGRRVSAYVYFEGAFGTDPFMAFWTSGFGVKVFQLQTTAGGVLQVTDGNNVQLGSNGSVLPADTWIRISVNYAITNSTTNDIRVYVNGVSDITLLNVTLSAGVGTSNFLFRGSASPAVYVSDVYIDNADSGADLTVLGDISVTAKRPDAVNVGDFATTLGTGAVNERPLDEANGVEDTGGLGVSQNYALESASSGDIDLTGKTIVGRSAWIWAKVSAASVLARLMDNGSASLITLTTSPAYHFLAVATAVYPTDAAGIGIQGSTTPNTFLYECGMLIAYTPAVAVTSEQGAYTLLLPRSRLREW